MDQGFKMASTVLVVSLLIVAGLAVYVMERVHKTAQDQMTTMVARDLGTAWTMSNNITASPSPLIVNGPTYTFAPTDDITAPELSEAIKILMPALACHAAIGCNYDVVPAIEAAPPNVRRHFRKD
jgi:hypothetical protein